MSLTQSTFDSLATILFFCIIFAFLTVPTLWLLLTFLTPKKVLEKYLKQPHFKDSEIEIMTSFPTSLLRTSILSWITVFPSLGKKRKLEGIRKNIPTWYKALIFLWIAIVIPSMVIIFGGLIFLPSVNIIK
ncbi:hypothetical protein ACPUEK_03640 [Marinomonas gallaica]|uniref:hypothetical protein n=1 Tax=Marinomonas gallaica TaxID=1806667 RepID=UPI003CE4E68C